MNTMLFQVLAAAAGALGFSLLYQIRGVKLIFCVLGGALSWLCYLLAAGAGLGIMWSYLAASMFVSVYAEVMARVLKAPATVFYVPAVIPLVPGGSLYYTMIAAMERNWAEFSARGLDTIAFAAAISGGILAVISVRSLFRSMKPKRK